MSATEKLLRITKLVKFSKSLPIYTKKSAVELQRIFRIGQSLLKAFMPSSLTSLQQEPSQPQSGSQRGHSYS